MRTLEGTSTIDYVRAQSEYWARILRLLEEIDQLIAAGAPQIEPGVVTGPRPDPPAIRNATGKTSRIHDPTNGEPTLTERIKRVLHTRGPMDVHPLTIILLAEGWQTAAHSPSTVVSMSLSKSAGTLFRVASAHGVRPKVWGLKRPPRAVNGALRDDDTVAAAIADSLSDVSTEAERKPS